MGGTGYPPDCGPHCKIKISNRLLGTFKIVHCSHKKCKQCHNKPIKNKEDG